MTNKYNTARQLTTSILLVVLLTFGLFITTYSLMMVSVEIKEHYFQTGNIEINLNDGNPVIEEHEFLFNPGMTVKKEFFIENLSTWDIYYKIYFEEVKGGLANILDITIQDGNKILFEGTAAELSRVNVRAADDTLQENEKRILSIYFHYPKDKGNITQNMTLSFDLCAEATQTKNNPNKLFD